MYRNGWGVSQDYKEAVRWYTMAAEQDYAIAQFNLGAMYENGEGVPQNYKEAVRLYTLAAEQGHAKAQSNLGVMYRNGEGVFAEFVTAHMWFKIAANNGNELAAENREKLEKRMTSEDISKAQAMARVCMISNYEKCVY